MVGNKNNKQSIIASVVYPDFAVFNQIGGRVFETVLPFFKKYMLNLVHFVTIRRKQSKIEALQI
jgi:hypothetical protein